MKARLAERGYFALERKRPLPAHPRRLALVTAPSGAAIRDFVRIAGERGYGCEIRVYPTLVQGEGAGRMIAAAIDRANTQGWAEAVALIRGGGSLEDLWAFNTEEVAEAVFRSRLPVIAGIGHEVDVSIADLVADVRAATPTHAAQLLWPERRVLVQQVDDLETALGRAFGAVLAVLGSAVDGLERNLRHLSPAQRIAGWAERFDREGAGLGQAWNRLLERKGAGLDKAEGALALAFGPGRLDGVAAETENLAGRLGRAGGTYVAGKSAGLDLAAARLAGLDPEGPLARGYGLVRVARTGRFLRRPSEVGPGDRLDIRVQGGHVLADVADAAPEAETRGERA
jgi:exodeoxyribonuclease VII large subunit